MRSVSAALINLTIVFAATSLAWNAFLFRANIGFELLLALFALGMTILFVIVWLALRMTRRFSLSTLYRWALPIMTIGVVLYQFSDTSFVVPVFLCLSIVNIGFEVMGKLFCVYVAKRQPGSANVIICIGFAAASIGGIIGTSLWAFILDQFGAGASAGTLLVALVVFVLAASISLGNNNDSADDKEHLAHGTSCGTDRPEEDANITALPEDDTVTRCTAIARQYGLSSRELEVLIMLSQGRSRAHIRETLYISKGTVDSHIHHIYAKIGINSKDELMRLILD